MKITKILNIKFVLYVFSTYKEDQIKTQTFIFIYILLV